MQNKLKSRFPQIRRPTFSAVLTLKKGVQNDYIAPIEDLPGGDELIKKI
ncbi:MAG: hypothetical protein L6V93_17935 [Clostridiales bacterium]|nr:MAG: hypothetical protein L6V93_17935 [Clostridiales bacterium]